MLDITIERLRGCAVGAAIGDAMGMPLEFGPRIHLNNLVRDMKSGRLPAGSFTDDTEMALALAESLLSSRPLDADDLAQRFLGWYQTHPPDVGFHTASVLNRIGGGESWREAANNIQGKNPNNAGNGSVMRCWPVGIAWWNNAEQLIYDSSLQSRVTHAHRDCIAGCVFINLMISLLVKGETKINALERALDVELIPEEMRQVLKSAPECNRDELINSGWVRHTIESAIWGLMTTNTFEEAVVQVVNLGNDADTARSVVGALAGAAYGISAISPRLQEKLIGEWMPGSGNRLDVRDFIALVDSLARGN